MIKWNSLDKIEKVFLVWVIFCAVMACASIYAALHFIIKFW